MHGSPHPHCLSCRATVLVYTEAKVDVTQKIEQRVHQLGQPVARGVTNSWLRQNRISEYGEYGQRWAIFVFSKRKTAFFEHQIRFSE